METTPPEISFAVEYQDGGNAFNPKLSGKGRLTIGTAEPTYGFTGKKRSLFGRGTTVQFHSDEVCNVRWAGRMIVFTLSPTHQGRSRGDFTFYCDTDATAAEVAQLFPKTLEPDYIASQGFAEKFQALPAAANPWTSVTNLIIAANVIAFVVMGSLGAGWFETADMKPYLLYTANNAGATTDGEWWRIVTCMFVHYGLLHLLLNMWALYLTGHFVERLLGRPLYTLGYFGSGIIASFSSIFWHGDKIWSAGASGAVFGVYGLLLGFMLRERQSVPKRVLQPLLKSTLIFAGYNLFYGMVHPQIDNAAHIGGLLGGVCLGWLVALPVDPDVRVRHAAGRLRMGAVALTIVMLAAVYFSPRYDYSFRDEMAWMEVNKAPGVREPELLKEQQKRLTQFTPENDAAELERWINGEVIPFYENWLQQVEVLVLTPDKVTARQRGVLVSFLKGRLQNYRKLTVELATGDAEALEHYYTAEDEAWANTPHAKGED
ncbi:MAG: rhomboid family intramembrane serine protease [Opitutaceae bacterium]|nr:rhomboid family intramembrane serine protease [Opitutaceae bacterium]MBP9913674.1 rhomboid family intramembrane serine protease [Opitutaceae bacterium]